jgi:hypothetical protein
LELKAYIIIASGIAQLNALIVIISGDHRYTLGYL